MDASATEPALRRFTFADRMSTIGLPVVDLPPEQELLELLKYAADVEHALMLQYLFASYSLKDQAARGLVRLIAIEEMGHFITVQNLLVACGADPVLGRGDWDSGSPFQPFAFRLEHASVGAIAKYTVAEMPDAANVPAHIRPELTALVGEADAAAGSDVETHRVGLLYAKIYWLLRRSDDPLQDAAQEPWPDFPVAQMAATPGLQGRHVADGFVTDARDRNALPGDWRGNYTNVIVAPISGRDSALKAIADISGQGEGFSETEEGHFERFFTTWKVAKLSGDLAIDVATNPFDRDRPTGADGGTEIFSNTGRQLAKIVDELYELVLLFTAASLLLPSGAPSGVRAKAAKAATIVMRECLGSVAGALTMVPIDDASPAGPRCGAPFAPPSDAVAPTMAAIVDRARALIASTRATAGDVQASQAPDEVQIAVGSVLDAFDNDIVWRLEDLAS